MKEISEVKQKEKISVIIPIYNVEKYLPKCIETILIQTYKNIEILLVDDGSPDECPNICDDFAKRDARIKVIHKKNGGVSSARNEGINNASGEYICFVDGDDYVTEDYVEYLYTILKDNDADISLSEKMYSNYVSKQNDNDKVSVNTGEDAAVEILCYKMAIGVYNKLFSRKLLGEKVRFLEHQFIGEGFNFNVTAFQHANRVAIGNRRIYYYRQDNLTSATKLFSEKKWVNGLKSIDDIRDNMVIRTDRLKKAWEFARWRTNTDVFDLIVISNSKKESKEMYKQALGIIKKYKLSAFHTETDLKERVRACMFIVHPQIIPLVMKFRRKLYGIRKNSSVTSN